MRVYDTEIKHQADDWSVEITEYHDEREGFVGPRRWHARVVILDDVGPKVLTFNRETQQDLFVSLKIASNSFEAALTSVLDGVNTKEELSCGNSFEG